MRTAFNFRVNFDQHNPFPPGRQSHEVVTGCLLAPAGFSFHNYVSKQHHVPIFGILLPVWLVAMGA